MNIDDKKWNIICSKEQIQEKVKVLGQQITNDYKDKHLMVICLLKGSFIFVADLVRQIDIPVKIIFMTTSSYGMGTHSSGRVKIETEIKEPIESYDVLIVDDIIDTGNTLLAVSEYLTQKNPKSLKSCTLLDKPSRRLADIHADYVGFEIPDHFVVGYGLNFGDYYRNIPYVFAVTDEEAD